MSSELENAKKDFYSALENVIKLKNLEKPTNVFSDNTRLEEYFEACVKAEKVGEANSKNAEKIAQVQREIHAIDVKISQIKNDLNQASLLKSNLNSKELSDKFESIEKTAKSETSFLNAQRSDLSIKLIQLERSIVFYPAENPYLAAFRHLQRNYLQDFKTDFELAIATEPAKNFLLILLAKFDDVQLKHGDHAIFKEVGEIVLNSVFSDFTNEKYNYSNSGKELVKNLFLAELAKTEEISA